MPNIAYPVACPTCHATPGAFCTSGTGKKATVNHKTRDAAANEAENGYLVEHLPEAPADEQAPAPSEPAAQPEEDAAPAEVDLEKMRQRIGKLLAKAEAEADLGNSDAAEAYFAKAAKLMAQHSISEALARGVEAEKLGELWVWMKKEKVPTHWWDPMGTQGTVLLMEALGNVGHAYAVKSRGIYLVGEQADIEAAAAVLVSCWRQALAALRGWKATDPSYLEAFASEAAINRSLGMRRSYAPGAWAMARRYLLGFMVGYARLVKSTREAVVEETTGAELVFLGKQKAIKEHMAGIVEMKRRRGTAATGTAFLQGLRDGQGADLGNRVEG